jgi:hypothetical protein
VKKSEGKGRAIKNQIEKGGKAIQKLKHKKRKSNNSTYVVLTIVFKAIRRRTIFSPFKR